MYPNLVRLPDFIKAEKRQVFAQNGPENMARVNM